MLADSVETLGKSLPANHLDTGRAMKMNSPTQVSFPDEIRCMDSTNTHEIVIPAGTTVAMTDLNVSSWYHFYAVKNTTTNAVDVIKTTNHALATAPSGFDVFRKLPFPIPTNASGDMILFDMLRSNGITRCRFREEDPSLVLWTNGLSGTGTLIAFANTIPTGETGATCSASLEISGTGDTNSSSSTILEKSIRPLSKLRVC